jgi:hypothetical protein
MLGHVSRDAFLMALIPNLGKWVESPFFYELGSTTVPEEVWTILRPLAVIERGHYLWGKYGLGGFLWLTGNFGTTIATGLTPGAWLGLTGTLEVLDCYSDRIMKYLSDL